MSITTNLIGFMATASSEKMWDVKYRLTCAVEAMGDETTTDVLGFLYADIYDAINVLESNISSAEIEEERTEKYRIENAKYGDDK